MRFKFRVGFALGGVAAVNVGAFAATTAVVSGHPLLLGAASLAYGLGLRHAFDADHIAAIDNVTRQLVAAGKRPAGIGLFFSLGHSSVVIAVSIGIALVVGRFENELFVLQGILGPIGTLLSSGFLLLMVGLNVVVLVGVWRGLHRHDPGDAPVRSGGPLSRALMNVIRRIDRSWLMLPLGAIFGLGFDTATEIGILGLTAA